LYGFGLNYGYAAMVMLHTKLYALLDDWDTKVHDCETRVHDKDTTKLAK